ncbi:MAG TPA: IclR family transcriptional regulator [Symbiobacteriaceae bacterium]|jgi:DNA-binding IclR family transcriptional regulator
MREGTRSVRAVDRALDLIDLLLERPGSLGVGEVARLANMPKSTAYRLLVTLESRGYLARGEDEKYQLGSRLQGAAARRPISELKLAAQSVLEGLRDTVGETAGLHVPDGDERICVAAAEGMRTLRTSGRIGSRAPLYSGASSKAILGFLPESRWEEVILRTGLKPLTARTITDPDRLRAELMRIQVEGYAVSSGEWGEGISSVAVPIFDPAGAVMASINISGPGFRFGEEKIRLLVGTLKAAADAVGGRLRANAQAAKAGDVL